MRPVGFPDGDLFYGPCESPYPLDNRQYLVSKDGNLLLRDDSGTMQVPLLEPRGELGFYNARPLRSRLRPPVSPSVLPPRGQTGPWAAVFVQEGFNNRLKLITRKSYGFRTQEAYETALFHNLGNLPEPQSTHRFC